MKRRLMSGTNRLTWTNSGARLRNAFHGMAKPGKAIATLAPAPANSRN